MAAIPGDWYIGHSDSESYPVKDQMRCVFSGQPNGERYMVAKVWAGDDGDYEGTARLVAAAPAMLGFLHQIADECRRRLRKGSDSGDLLTLQLCNAAISKAQGGDAWDASMVGQTPR